MVFKTWQSSSPFGFQCMRHAFYRNLSISREWRDLNCMVTSGQSLLRTWIHWPISRSGKIESPLQTTCPNLHETEKVILIFKTSMLSVSISTVSHSHFTPWRKTLLDESVQCVVCLIYVNAELRRQVDLQRSPRWSKNNNIYIYIYINRHSSVIYIVLMHEWFMKK